MEFIYIALKLSFTIFCMHSINAFLFLQLIFFVPRLFIFVILECNFSHYYPYATYFTYYFLFRLQHQFCVLIHDSFFNSFFIKYSANICLFLLCALCPLSFLQTFRIHLCAIHNTICDVLSCCLAVNILRDYWTIRHSRLRWFALV